MQDIEYLVELGADPEKLKKKLLATPPSAKIKELLEMNESRINSALRRGLEDSRMYWTIDRIIDASLRNIKFVQARELMSNRTVIEVDKLISQFQKWGLDNMITPVVGEDGKAVMGANNQPKLELNVPIFDTVLVPLVMAYRTIRLAKLFDDRNLYPLYKYSPSHKTTKAVAQCEVITSVMQRMSEEMGYSATMKQCILQMLDYGWALRMPDSAWYREEYQTKEKGKDKPITRTQREGVRWAVTRPERSFIDLSYPVSQLNSDTGPAYMGYWDLKRYGEVKRNKKLWQTDKMNYGAASLLFNSSAWGIYSELFPCQLKVPTCGTSIDYATMDREDKQFWYSTGNNDDLACTQVCLFCKLVPSDYDLFDYDHPVWMRFLYGDTCTLLYAEALPYTPGAIYLYDYDANRANQNSLTLQLSPYQQMIGNYLTQYLISVRNNLPRIVYYNKDIVNQEHIQRMKSQKAKLYQELTFLPFSSRELSHQQQKQGEAFSPLIFPQVNTMEIVTAVKTTIEMLERMMGFSAQEIGQPAVHEQTAREIVVVAENTTVRQKLTGDGVDEAEKAVKRTNYEAWVNYGSDEVVATVTGVDPAKKKALEEMGFEVEEGDSNANNTYGVKGKKAALRFYDFASSQEGQTRAQEPKVAIAMMQMLSVVMQNPMVFQVMGVDQIVSMINDVMVWSGLPDDFRVVIDPKKTPKAMQEDLIKAVDAIRGKITEEVGQQMQKNLMELAETLKAKLVDPMQQAMAQIGAKLGEMTAHDIQQDQQIQEIQNVIGGMVRSLGGGVPPIPPPVPPGLIQPMSGPGGPVVGPIPSPEFGQAGVLPGPIPFGPGPGVDIGVGPVPDNLHPPGPGLILNGNGNPPPNIAGGPEIQAGPMVIPAGIQPPPPGLPPQIPPFPGGVEQPPPI